MSIAVITKAATTALTTLAAVKTELKITDNTDDAWLTKQIDVANALAINYLNVEAAEDGTSNLGVESLVETIDQRGGWPWSTSISPLPVQSTKGKLSLGRRPVLSITSITEDGTAVDSADFLLTAISGSLRRLSNLLPIAWPSSLIVVTYSAGWKLPGDSGRNLPNDIEQAVIDIIKMAYSERSRDPNVKSEHINIPGVRDKQVDYFFGSPGQESGPFPPTVCAKLDPYRNVNL